LRFRVGRNAFVRAEQRRLAVWIDLIAFCHQQGSLSPRCRTRLSLDLRRAKD
jgi:hypothetical protein